MMEPERKKRSSSTSGSSLVSSPPASTQRSLKSSSSFPDNSLAPQSDGDDTATTPFLLQCKSINETNRTPINEGSQYGQLLSSILESNDTKKHAANAEPSVSVSDWKKVFLSSHEIEFCTKNGVMLDVASSEITKLKVEGIACYGCNLLVLTEGQVAVSPTSMTSILDDPGTDITNIGNDIMTSTLSRTTFVMGRRLIRQSGLHRMDSRYLFYDSKGIRNIFSVIIIISALINILDLNKSLNVPLCNIVSVVFVLYISSEVICNCQLH